MSSKLDSLKEEVFVETKLAEDKEPQLKEIQIELKKLRDQPLIWSDQKGRFEGLLAEEKKLLNEINQHYENARKAELKIEFASNPPPPGQNREEQILSQMRSGKDRSKGGPER